jgi:hypothetical protein
MSPAQTAEPKSKSTGPRTHEGKQRSAMNATRHGLTGRTIVMPYEDMDAYHVFCNELLESLAPETPVERQYAQAFCDTQWRLNRARSLEDAMLSLGHFEEAGNIDVNHCQVHAALTAGRVFRDDSRSFVNLSLYEQRLQRTLEKSLKQLQTLQGERRVQNEAVVRQAEKDRQERIRLEESRLEKERLELEKERLELEKARLELGKVREPLRNLHEMRPKPPSPVEASAAGEFVFSSPEIDPEARCVARAERAQTAEIYETAAPATPTSPEKQAA